ncbi:M20/M25/M40 family metallo-hydrolase [Gudongella oleilytica]|uniref:M20/M25/M40 family metallo-hydrolase n=1 Tax=Gudongella oleilytica TaxID=1582259 RepID=UPI002A3695FB|nr:M20/M25/M40 family metallo-hydrolase [Gudongella oleilytica]MDY0257407.1 M20/M25/M40 family metallo-hydrolase [Gudongella oleilytica]
MERKIKELLYELVSVQSDTGTYKEREIEKFIHNYLGNIDYFRENPENFGLHPVDNDRLGRSIVWGLLKGEGSKTVILLHHHDVVDSFDYGVIKELAYNPDALAESIRNADINMDTLRDLEAGGWIFGRGTADMKAAAAIHMVLLSEYCNNKDFNGNILFLSVPDEESLSLGARESAKLLQDIRRKYSLEYLLCIDGEPYEKDEEGRSVIYEGSVGKTMVVIYVRGKKTHIGHIFQGLNPSHILSEIVAQIDMNPVYSDVVAGEVSPPPSWSFVRDTKEQYDASIPESAGGYFSVLTLSQSPRDILEKTIRMSEDAFENVIKKINQHYSNFRLMGNLPIETLPWESNVKLFSEVYNQAIEDSGEGFLAAYQDKFKQIKDDISANKTNIPNSTLDLISMTLDYVKDKSPKVVIAFSPPYYPHIANLDFNNLGPKVLKIGRELVDYAKKSIGKDYSVKNYFMGISDLSYFALNNSEAVIPYIEPNMPHWGRLYSIPFEDIKALSIPIINIGPWGKDYHKFTERVFTEDVLYNTPKLTKFAIEYLLSD